MVTFNKYIIHIQGPKNDQEMEIDVYEHKPQDMRETFDKCAEWWELPTDYKIYVQHIQPAKRDKPKLF